MDIRRYRSVVLAGALLCSSPVIVTFAQAPADTSRRGQAGMTDDALEDRIAHRLESNATLRKYDVRVDVVEKVAKLSGKVATSALKAEAERVAKLPGITRVDNQVTIDPDVDTTVAARIKSGVSKTGDKIDDAWILTKVKWFLTGEDVLDGSDINVDVKDNTVTLKGTVRSTAARTRAIELATNTEGVKRVTDQLTVLPASR
jgi:hyperosmotically inducible protein